MGPPRRCEENCTVGHTSRLDCLRNPQPRIRYWKGWLPEIERGFIVTDCGCAQSHCGSRRYTLQRSLDSLHGKSFVRNTGSSCGTGGCGRFLGIGPAASACLGLSAQPKLSRRIGVGGLSHFDKSPRRSVACPRLEGVFAGKSKRQCERL